MRCFRHASCVHVLFVKTRKKLKACLHFFRICDCFSDFKKCFFKAHSFLSNKTTPESVTSDILQTPALGFLTSFPLWQSMRKSNCKCKTFRAWACRFLFLKPVYQGTFFKNLRNIVCSYFYTSSCIFLWTCKMFRFQNEFSVLWHIRLKRHRGEESKFFLQ